MSQMTIREFEELNLFSNKNVEKVISTIVNESSNAALVAVYEDSVILLDHNEGRFYSADYKFESEGLKLTLENFDEIELEKEDDDFKAKARNFFEDDNASVQELAEAYRNDVIDQDGFVSEIINEALSLKSNSGIVDYSELVEANEYSLADEDYFKEYVERLETNPLNEVKFFNFEDKVVVSLFETEKIKLVNSSVREKAEGLWKNQEFKATLSEALEIMIENFEDGKDLFEAVLEEYPQIFSLDKAERNSLFGKTILTNRELAESRKDIMKGIEIIFEGESVQATKEIYLSEAEEEEETDDDDDDDSDSKEDKTPAKELTPEQISSITDELKTLSKKVEDEGLKEKLDSIIGKLDKSMNEGTRPDVIKEAVQLLMI